MGIFDKIKGAIWGHEEIAPDAKPTASEPSESTLTTAVAPEIASAAPAGKPVSRPVEQNAPTRMTEVDVAKQLDQAAKASGQKLNWRTSIVDLMKVVGLDASLQERKELARELNYTGDTSDTAAMNMWLHKELMRKLAENGGKVPAELVD